LFPGILLVAVMLRPSKANLAAVPDTSQSGNLVTNSDFHLRQGDQPAGYQLSGDALCRYLGDPRKDMASGWGVALDSAGSNGAGAVSQMVSGIDAGAGRWFRFTFRGLPQDNFAVADGGLWMKAEFFVGGKAADGKRKRIDDLIEQARRELSVNGDFHRGGAAVWRTYQLDFYLPFPQVDQVRLSVGFDHGLAHESNAASFFVTDLALHRIEGVSDQSPSTMPVSDVASNVGTKDPPAGQMIPLGGRWYYRAKDGEASAARHFDYQNADRLYYHDDVWSTPFAGEMTSWLRAGEKDIDGNLVSTDRFVPDNVTIDIDQTSLVIHTRGLPNHPTGRFPQPGWHGNPNYIQEQHRTYHIPLDPKVNPRHIVTTANNSNHALPMGPIGIAMNGVVFYNPFDAQSTDASNIMDYCCGHPDQRGTYHYHKYPICINSPWADEGKSHSPVIGWAFDGFPVYGPYESAGVLAKDVMGEHALNDFNLHWDSERGWHYHVTPGKFPYIIGGYWGTEDSRDSRRMGPPGGGPPGGGPPGGGPPGMGPGGMGLSGTGRGGGGPGFGGPPPPPPW
jgi:hypothetical protein